MKYVVSLNGKNYEVEVTESDAVLTKVTDAPAPAPAAAAVAPSAPAAAAPASQAPVSGGTNIISPMPGTILSVNVTVGQAVKAGQKVAVIEAMKMENEIQAETDGTVTAVLVSKGDSVLEGAEIVKIA